MADHTKPLSVADAPASPTPAHLAPSRLAPILAVIFAFVGAVMPVALAYYEHHVKWLAIRTLQILWPASLVLLPDPSARTAILWNSISIALNAVIYGMVGFLLGYALELLARGRTARTLDG
ncbi:MAG: hypothetical protein WBS18_01870 [Candidatus Acidiferrales bacterium]